jgi:hypothetical protein
VNDRFAYDHRIATYKNIVTYDRRGLFSGLVRNRTDGHMVKYGAIIADAGLSGNENAMERMNEMNVFSYLGTKGNKGSVKHRKQGEISFIEKDQKKRIGFSHKDILGPANTDIKTLRYSE